MFVFAWALSSALWKFGRVEERYDAAAAYAHEHRHANGLRHVHPHLHPVGLANVDAAKPAASK